MSECYKFYQIKDNQNLKQSTNNASFVSKAKEHHVSKAGNFTAHCWLSDGKFLVGTDEGEVILCESTGEFKLVLKDPALGQGFSIEQIKCTKQGFLVCGKGGEIKLFERKDVEPSNPFSYVASLPTESIMQSLD